jgi:hypothetical protein
LEYLENLIVESFNSLLQLTDGLVKEVVGGHAMVKNPGVDRVKVNAAFQSLVAKGVISNGEAHPDHWQPTIVHQL